MPTLPTFTNTDQATSPFEDGYQNALRASLPDNLYLSPMYAIQPAFENSFYNNSLMGYLGNIAAVKGFKAYDDIRGKTPVSPEKAKEVYGLSINEPTQESVLQYMYGRKKDKDILEGKIGAVENSGTKTLMEFTGGIAGGVSADLGFMMVAAPVLSRAGSMFMETTNLLKYGKVAQASSFLSSEGFASSLARGALTETAQFLALEAPLAKYSSSLVNEEYGVADFLSNMAQNAAGGAFFGGVGWAYRKAKGTLKERFGTTEAKLNDSSGITNAVKDIITVTGEASTYINKSPEVVPTKLLESRLNVPTNPEAKYSYVYRAVEDVKTTKFYNGHTTQNGKLNINTQVEVKERFGKGVVLSDNKDLISNSAKNGTVVTVDIDANATLFDTSTKPDITLLGKIKEAFEYFLGDDIAEVSDVLNGTFDDIMAEARMLSDVEGTDLPIEMMNTIFKDAGYDGYRFTGEMGGELHNGLFLFDPKSMIAREFELGTTTKVVDSFTKTEIDGYQQKLLDYRSNIDYDPDYDIIKTIEIDDNFEANYINSKIEKEFNLLADELGELAKVTGTAGYSLEAITEMASRKVTRSYRGKEELVKTIQSALEAEVKSLSDTFDIPQGLVDQRKLINDVKDKLFSNGDRAKVDVGAEILDKMAEEIDKAREIFNAPVESLNQDQLLTVARETVLKKLDLNTGYDKVREAAKALILCRGE